LSLLGNHTRQETSNEVDKKKNKEQVEVNETIEKSSILQ
jgi:hypothetical protein